MMKQLAGAFVASLALTATASAQTPIWGEFQINTYTTGYQFRPRAAMEPDGDFVVVWQGLDGSSDGVFGQRFEASGVLRGSEFRINTYPRTARPAVAIGSGGDFVAVWAIFPYGSASSIQGARYDASGSPIGPEFLVNDFTNGGEDGPRVGRAADGRFVVSWVIPNDGNSFGIAARRFDAVGDPAGSAFLVNTYTPGLQVAADIAVQADGTFVIVWDDRSINRDGSGSAIFGQRYDASGNRLGSDFRVNTYTTGNQVSASVSVSPAGGFVVAWTSQYGDGSGSTAFARRFDASGSAVGNDFVVNTYTTGDQSGGQVVHDAGGNFVVTWGGADGSSGGVFAQRFSDSGARYGGEFRVNTYTTGTQQRPSVASDATGNFVVVWESNGQDGSNYGIFGQRHGDVIFADGFDAGGE
jgi:hypothetical protein